MYCNVFLLYFQVDAAFNKSSNCYEIKTHKSYKKYDQVFISYGPHNNIHLLLEYGFILPDDPHDVYEIDFGKFFPCWSLLIQEYNDHEYYKSYKLPPFIN
jgi:hypothetical protein